MIPQPKILTAITVPTGGWALRIQISNAAPYDVNVDFTIAAGTYYLAWDGQSDDFLHQLCSKFYLAATVAGYANTQMNAYLDSNHKVVLAFHGSHYNGATGNQIKIKWTTNNGSDIAKVLGFDYATDDTTNSNYPHVTGDYHHGYGWYADADGRLEDILTEDVSEAMVLQSRAHSGKVVTQLISERWRNELMLRWLPQDKTFSRGVGYGESPLYPYDYNEGLECWWELAKQGTQFRVYADGCSLDTSRANRYLESGGTATTVTLSGVTLSTTPQRYKGALLYQATWNVNGTAFGNRFYVASHTSTVLTISNGDPTGLYNIGANDSAVYLFDYSYQTYVVDLGKMKEFLPKQAARHALWDLDIPLWRYV